MHTLIQFDLLHEYWVGFSGLSLGTTSNSYTIGRVSAGTSAGTDTSVNGQASTTNSGGLLLLNGGTGSTVGDVRIGTNPVSPEVRIGGSTTVIGLRGASTQISGQLEFVDAAQSSLAVVTAGSNILSLGQPTSSSFTVQRRPNNAGNGGELKILAGEGTVSGGNLEIKAGSAPTTAGSISIFGGDGSTRGSIVIGNSLASSPDALVGILCLTVDFFPFCVSVLECVVMSVVVCVGVPVDMRVESDLGMCVQGSSCML
mgnify:CR=1 FL=1